VYEPFWSAAEEYDFSIGFHEGGSSGMPTAGIDRFEGRAAKHIISHTMEMMLASLSIIWGGVVERHPKLRVAFHESGGGWVAPWLDRMDRHFDDQGFNDSGLKTRPSDLFRRNSWISLEPVEGSLRVLAEYIGPHKILWATDYPHRNGFFPGARGSVSGAGRWCDGVLRSELSIATSADRLIWSSSFRPVVMSSATVSGALFGRSLATGQVEGGID
jgi:predicted TIM-barrel fold metal-dependent hydrolase